MKSYSVYAYNDRDEKMVVFNSSSFEESVHVAAALYRASDLEFKILDQNENCLVSFIQPHND